MTETQTTKTYTTPGNHNLYINTDRNTMHKQYSGNIIIGHYDTSKCLDAIHLNSVENALKFDKQMMRIVERSQNV